MTDRDPIDKDLIETYRARRAPPDLANRVMRAASREPAGRGRLVWLVPATAVCMLAILLYSAGERERAERVPPFALSLASIPKRALIFPTRHAVHTPSLASLDPLPALAPVGLSLSGLKGLNSPYETRHDTNTVRSNQSIKEHMQ
jgi:hypothetical protein